MKDSFAVITTIFPPTKTAEELLKKGFRLIVAGDKKTPKNWNCNLKEANTAFLDCDIPLGFKIEKVLPYNHYCRKMTGYIFAKKEGAEFIYETDDDTFLKDNFQIKQFDEKELFIPENKGFVNIYNYYTEKKVWPRGYPVDLINENPKKEKLEQKDLKIGVYQGLVDNEPDVDAIYRLTCNKTVNFEDAPDIALSEGTICPYNTQNTFTKKELFPLLYLPSTVTFRFTDILRSIVAQPVMWEAGYHVCFTKATAIQIRNNHDYIKDFESEIPMYLYTKKAFEITKSTVQKGASIKDNLYNSYCALEKENIVEEGELKILQAFLEDI